MTEESETNTKSEDATSDEEVKSVDAKGDEDPAAKKRSLIIRGVVIAGLAYYGVTEFILKEEPPPAPPVAQVKPKQIEKKVEEQKQPDAKVDAVQPTDLPQPDAKATNELTKQEDIQPPVENINVAKKQEEAIAPPANIPEVAAPPAGEKELDNKIDQLIAEEVKPEPVKSARSGERQERTHEEVNLADKIVVEDKYVEPPSFEYLGRGLVYNCKEKFWACINKPSYIQCNKNMKWNSANNKPIECAVANVYNSNDDCEIVQKYNVSTAQPTPFCKQ